MNLEKPSQVFKIDRSQRMHGGGIVARVYQVFGEQAYGWDLNRGMTEQSSLSDSLEQAQQNADAGVHQTGHICTDACYEWREVK